jgi:UDP-N-acetylmuramyl pentapeptide phosphotransferase/UDP-N-acetylglucosamine-1-phosphate transferase
MSNPSIPENSRRRRNVLWLVLVISAAANVVASTAGLNLFIGLAAGLVTVACAAALIVDHYQHRGR